MVADRRTDEALEQIERGALADGRLWLDLSPRFSARRRGRRRARAGGEPSRRGRFQARYDGRSSRCRPAPGAAAARLRALRQEWPRSVWLSLCRSRSKHARSAEARAGDQQGLLLPTHISGMPRPVRVKLSSLRARTATRLPVGVYPSSNLVHCHNLQNSATCLDDLVASWMGDRKRGRAPHRTAHGPVSGNAIGFSSVVRLAAKAARDRRSVVRLDRGVALRCPRGGAFREERRLWRLSSPRLGSRHDEVEE